MKILVVYFSRTGHTRTLARQIAAALRADLDEIQDDSNRRGILGYLRSGSEAWFGRRANIWPPGQPPQAYDLVLIGTPVWRASVCSPVRTYLADHAAELKQVAFFATMGQFGGERALRQMQAACGKEPLATLALTERQLAGSGVVAAVAAFAGQLGRYGAGANPAVAQNADAPR
jgi:flavodoxin